MVNEEIFGGLKSALERGESLKRAMMTLYNSGYKKEEIEECAKILLEYNRENQVEMPSPEIIQTIPEAKPQIQQPANLQKSAQQIQKITPQIQTTVPYHAYAPIQRISDYEGGISSREKAVIIILVSLLVFLIVSLGLIFLFKQELINFFGNLFGQ